MGALFVLRVLTCSPNTSERSFGLYWFFALGQAYMIASATSYTGIDRLLFAIFRLFGRSDDPSTNSIHTAAKSIFSARVFCHLLRYPLYLVRYVVIATYQLVVWVALRLIMIMLAIATTPFKILKMLIAGSSSFYLMRRV